MMHYAKRLLEVVFVHKYSGKMPLMTSLFMSLNYSFIGYCFGSILHSDSDRYKKLEEEHGGVDLWSAVGMSLWLIGMGGNAWHHWLLARARKGKQYVKLSSIGGLFREALPCPHYLLKFSGLDTHWLANPPITI